MGINLAATLGLFFVTAFFEILGCYWMGIFIKNTQNWQYLVSAVCSLLVFAYLLTFHPMPSGKVYAIYGGVYIFSALCWLMIVDKVKLSWNDMLGAVVCLIGILIILAPWKKQGII